MEEIKGDDYSVTFDPEAMTIKFQGELSLGGPKDYEPIVNLLNKAANSGPAQLTLDVRELGFLNSSGISMLSKFVMNLRNKRIQLTILGGKNVPWQGKSLSTLKKLLPTLNLVFD